MDTRDKLKCSWNDKLECIDGLKNWPLSRPLEFSDSTPANSDASNDDPCSWENWLSCNNSVQPRLSATSHLNWTWGVIVVVVLAVLLYCISWWVRKRMAQTVFDIISALLLAYCLTKIFAVPPPSSQFHWVWGFLIVAIVCSFFCWWIREREEKRVKPFNLRPYFALGVGVLLLLAYWHTPLWNAYFTSPDAEPFYWLEGVSAWPSQLLRLSATLFAAGFFFLGSKRIWKTQNDLQAQWGSETRPSFALPIAPDQLRKCDVIFVNSWEKNEQETTVSPDDLWNKYLSYCWNKKGVLPGSFLRVLIHGLAFFFMALLLMMQSGFPDAPVRGDKALGLHRGILFVAVVCTILLTMWVVEHARLCERLIFHLSDKPSLWNTKARNWAIHDNKVAPECVNDWLDIQLVARLTKTIQPLIWGPMVCLALLMLARSSVIDDWDYPWGLILVLTAMVFYAISAEVRLQNGAKLARAKAIKQLTDKIKAHRNKRSNEVVIKPIEDEIERIRTLSEGAFRPWYQWPLLQAFGGLSAFVVALEKYFSWVLETNPF